MSPGQFGPMSVVVVFSRTDAIETSHIDQNGLPFEVETVAPLRVRDKEGNTYAAGGHIERLADRFILAFFSGSVGLVSVLLLALPTRAITVGGTNVNQAIGYAGLAAATLLGLRALAAIGRHRN